MTTTVKNITLTSSDLVQLAEDFGAQVQEQKSFFKVTSPSKNRKAIYIAKAKRTITKVDFSGFEVEGTEVLKALTKEEAKELRLGAVRGQIVTKGLPVETDDASILEAVEYGLAILMNEEEGFKFGKRVVEEETSSEDTVEEEA